MVLMFVHHYSKPWANRLIIAVKHVDLQISFVINVFMWALTYDGLFLNCRRNLTTSDRSYSDNKQYLGSFTNKYDFLDLMAIKFSTFCIIATLIMYFEFPHKITCTKIERFAVYW